MFDVGRMWRRWGTGVVSVAAGLLTLWVALHSSGSDWFYSENYADVLYTAVWSFHQLPLFSFVFNGGSYFLQDPQSSLFSPSVLAIVGFGPSIGLRLMIAVWGGFGCYLTIAWLRRRVHETAAQLAALAWLMSLAFLWHIAVGNDMFMWHLALPGLLLLSENVLARRSLPSALGLGLALGLLLLGPSFHSLTYLLVPALLLFVPLEVMLTRPGLRNTAYAFALFALSLAVALLIASPKFACWARFDMSRVVDDPGALQLKAAIAGLLDYSASKWHYVPNIIAQGAPPTFTLGTEETATALPPTAILLFLVGLACSFQRVKLRPTAVFAATLLVLSLTLSCSTVLWQHIRELTSGGIRASQRFLGMAGFGLAVFTALGGDVVFRRWPKAVWPLAGVVAASFVAAPLWWVHSAGNITDRDREDTVRAEAMPLFSVIAQEHGMAEQLRTDGYRDLVHFEYGKRELIKGRGYSDGYAIVGNQLEPKLFRNGRARIRSVPILQDGLEPANVRIEHMRITLKQVPAGAEVQLRIREPAFGLAVETVPPGAPVELKFGRTGCVLTHRGTATLSKVTLRPRLPISWIWFVVSGVGLAGTLGALLLMKWAVSRRKGRLTPSAPTQKSGFEGATDRE
jgi:hypothetical protein